MDGSKWMTWCEMFHRSYHRTCETQRDTKTHLTQNFFFAPKVTHFKMSVKNNTFPSINNEFLEGRKSNLKLLFPGFSSEGSYLLLWWPTKSKSATLLTLFDNQDGTKVVFVARRALVLPTLQTPNFYFFCVRWVPKKLKFWKWWFFLREVGLN